MLSKKFTWLTSAVSKVLNYIFLESRWGPFFSFESPLHLRKYCIFITHLLNENQPELTTIQWYVSTKRGPIVFVKKNPIETKPCSLCPPPPHKTSTSFPLPLLTKLNNSNREVYTHTHTHTHTPLIKCP